MFSVPAIVKVLLILASGFIGVIQCYVFLYGWPYFGVHVHDWLANTGVSAYILQIAFPVSEFLVNLLIAAPAAILLCILGRARSTSLSLLAFTCSLLWLIAGALRQRFAERFGLDDDCMGWGAAHVLADVSLRRRPNHIPRFEVTPDFLAVRQVNHSIEWLKRVQDESRMFVLMCLLTRLISIIKDAEAAVFQQDFVLVTVGFDRVVRKARCRHSEESERYNFPVHANLLLKLRLRSE